MLEHLLRFNISDKNLSYTSVVQDVFIYCIYRCSVNCKGEIKMMENENNCTYLKKKKHREGQNY